MSKKKRTATLLCVFVAAAVFSVSAAAAVRNYSGYERTKAALFGLIETIELYEERNATYDLSISLSGGGGTLAAERKVIQSDGRATLTRTIDSYDGQQYEYVSYADPDVNISGSNGAYREYPNYSYGSGAYSGSFSSGGGIIGGTSATQLRFLEVLFDTLVGDTKNYFVTDGDKVSLSLSDQQIPELAQLALAIVAEEFSHDVGYYGESYEDGEYSYDYRAYPVLGSDAQFSHMNFSAEFDGQGGFSSVRAELGVASTFNGSPANYAAEIDYRVSDVGTTVVEKPSPVTSGGPATAAESYDDLREMLPYQDFEPEDFGYDSWDDFDPEDFGYGDWGAIASGAAAYARETALATRAPSPAIEAIGAIGAPAVSPTAEAA
ncbi:MAG: hypothetical protein LBL83_09665 [Clostridiales bacterium]|jgi:hypothetical protein|nr:hypothetical protein [Clostridiales bacterium]